MSAVLDERPAVTTARMLPPAGTSDTSRWRVPARLARREVRRRPWRTVLVLLLIGVPVAGLTLADVAYRSAQVAPDDTITRGAAAFTVWISTSDTTTDVPQVVRRLVPDLVADGSVVVWQEAQLPLRSVDRPDEVVWTSVRTLDAAQPLAAGMTPLVDGRLPRDADEIVLDAEAADRFGVAVGDQLTLVRPAQSFTVVGIGRAAGVVMTATGFDVAATQPGIFSSRLLVDDGAAGALRTAEWPFGVYPSFAGPETDRPVDATALLFGWLVGVMLMAVLGVVVAAAFAVSGRRQLVLIGQLGANGADPVVIRRFLALQGTVAGTVASVGGVVVALAAAPVMGDVVAPHGRLVVDPRDIAVVVLTAVAVSTVAALLPARALVRSSVLTALGGRRPVTPVRRSQVPWGAGLLAVGSAGLWVAVTAVSHTSSAEVPAMLLATASGLATLAGVCCLCPVVIDLVARAGSRRRGALLLAARSLGRHRARSAALLAAIVSVAAVGVGAGSVADHELANRRSYPGPSGDLRTVQVEVWSNADARGAGTREPLSDGTRRSIERIVGPVRWVASRTVLPVGVAADRAGIVPLVADDDVLEAIGLDADERAEVARHDAVLLDPIIEGDSNLLDTAFVDVLPDVDVVAIAPRRGVQQRLVVSARVAAERDLVLGTGPTFALLDHDLTRTETDALQALTVAAGDSAYFRGAVDPATTVSFDMGFPERDWSTIARAAIVLGLLLLVLAVVVIGLALWAAEGRSEHDTLVAVGAPPGVLARSAGLRAWLLTTVGALLGVPFGWWFVRVAASAADAELALPWFVVGGVVLVVPTVVSLAAWLGSALAQRRRRGRVATVAAD